MKEQAALILAGSAVCIATALARKYAWTPKKNAWWDPDSFGSLTTNLHRLVLSLAFLLGLGFILSGVLAK